MYPTRTAQRKTKIVATLGPATSSRESIRALIRAGIDVARFNFSHGTHESHLEILNILREEAQKEGRVVAAFQDLCGPKVRIAEMENGSAPLVSGELITLKHYNTPGQIGNEQEIFVEAFDPRQVLKTGDLVYLSDGRIELIVKEHSDDGVVCEIFAGGDLRSRSGIAAPSATLDLPCLTEKDLRDLEWGVKNGLDYIALSFVGKPQDVSELKTRIRRLGGTSKVISKIERACALDHLEDIIDLSDAVMVARGDLGLELPLERVPGAQRLIIRTALAKDTPVITATQMLRSMVDEARPTRAEVSDVWTAVRDGSDAVMLSEETAIGKYPARTIQVLDRILREAEGDEQFSRPKTATTRFERSTIADAMSYAATTVIDKLSARAIITLTESGSSARFLSKYRPQTPLYGVTRSRVTLSQMCLYWGVNPILIELEDEELDTGASVLKAIIAIRDKGDIKPGSRVVTVSGLKSGEPTATATMQIREVPREEPAGFDRDALDKIPQRSFIL